MKKERRSKYLEINKKRRKKERKSQRARKRGE